MNAILNAIAKIAYKYGIEGAEMPSFRGTYEMEVPAELIKFIDQEEQKNDGC